MKKMEYKRPTMQVVSLQYSMMLATSVQNYTKEPYEEE